MLVSFLPLALLLGGPPHAVPEAQAPPPQAAVRLAPVPRKLFNESADAKAQIATAVASAADDGIRVLVVWGANDAERCSTFPQLQRSPEISGPKYLSNEYKVVYVDVGQADRNVDVAGSLGAKPARDGLPFFTVLDRAGTPIAQASAADFAGQDPALLDAKKFGAFLSKNQAAAPEAEPLLKAALSQAKKDGKYLFLWFSAPW